jgi:hypothetical protein
MRINLLDEHARELAKMPPEWIVYAWRHIDDNTTEVKGVIAPLKTVGKNKGLHNWGAADKATDRTVYVTTLEHDAFRAAWEDKTGHCAECIGTGEVVKSWERDKGMTYRKCSACASTGASRIKKE